MVNTFGVNYIIRNKKVVFFDFDDTLCVHLRLGLNEDTHAQWQKAMFEQDKEYYLDTSRCLAPKSMLSFIIQLFEGGVKCECLTWSSDCRVYEPKKNFLFHRYKNCFSNLFVTGTREGKIKFLKNYCENYGLSFDDILLIDDHPQTLADCRAAGIECISPVAVITYLDYYKGGKD